MNDASLLRIVAFVLFVQIALNFLFHHRVDDHTPSPLTTAFNTNTNNNNGNKRGAVNAEYDVGSRFKSQTSTTLPMPLASGGGVQSPPTESPVFDAYHRNRRPRVSVVVVAYNSETFIAGRRLQNTARMTPDPISFFVVHARVSFPIITPTPSLF
jgi:hypothetical protein